MKILVHLHLYYADMLPEMLNSLRSLEGRAYDLYVTLVKDCETVKKEILAFKNDAQIMMVDNRGYDLAPFLKVLQSVSLDDYGYVIKLHTKRDLPKPAHLPYGCFKNSEWRNCLMGFLKDRQTFVEAYNLLEKHSEIGMLSHWKLIVKSGKEDREATRRAEEIMQQLGLPPKERRFVAGTMFICRAKLMKPLLRLNYMANDFDVPAPNHAGGTLAHAMERVLGWLVYAQNSQIASYEPFSFGKKLQVLLFKSRRFLYRKHTNSKGITRIKICKIPVCTRRP